MGGRQTNSRDWSILEAVRRVDPFRGGHHGTRSNSVYQSSFQNDIHYIYGEELDKNSVVLSFNSPNGQAIELKDDGYGNLYNSAYAS